jgi:hypothetical protein
MLKLQGIYADNNDINITVIIIGSRNSSSSSSSST